MKEGRNGVDMKRSEREHLPAQMNRPLGENCAAYNIQGLVSSPCS